MSVQLWGIQPPGPGHFACLRCTHLGCSSMLTNPGRNEVATAIRWQVSFSAVLNSSPRCGDRDAYLQCAMDACLCRDHTNRHPELQRRHRPHAAVLTRPPLCFGHPRAPSNCRSKLYDSTLACNSWPLGPKVLLARLLVFGPDCHSATMGRAYHYLSAKEGTMSLRGPVRCSKLTCRTPQSGRSCA